MELLTSLTWSWVFLILVGSMLLLMMSGMPVAFAFMLPCWVGAFIWYGGEAGLILFISNMRESMLDFSFVPLPLFILMGAVMFASGIAPSMMETLDKWIGRVPGRLGLLAVVSGTIIASLTGASVASTAMLGSALVPEMQKRGYKKSMALGPILGSGCLAPLIPPSDLVILVAALGHISVGKGLIAVIIPGLIMATLFAIYIVGRCWLDPSLAPPYDKPVPALRERIILFLKYVLPLSLVILSVVGVIFIGIATPTEGAATGALSTFILAAAYRKLNWRLVKEATEETLKISIMIFMIIVTAKTYSQILSFSGAAKGLLTWVTTLGVAPSMFIVMLMFLLLIVGMFMSVPAFLIVAIPIWMPIIEALGLNSVWFLVLLVINVEIGQISPPYGAGLFTMKTVAPPNITLNDVYKAAIPFCIIETIVMFLIVFFPQLALWLPSLMMK